MDLEELTAIVMDEVRNAPVPLLVFGVQGDSPQILRAVSRTCTGILRRRDPVAHDPGTNRYLVAMVSRSRSGQLPSATAARALAERVGAMLSVSSFAPVQSCWTIIADCR